MRTNILNKIVTCGKFKLFFGAKTKNRYMSVKHPHVKVEGEHLNTLLRTLILLKHELGFRGNSRDFEDAVLLDPAQKKLDLLSEKDGLQVS